MAGVRAAGSQGNAETAGLDDAQRCNRIGGLEDCQQPFRRFDPTSAVWNDYWVSYKAPAAVYGDEHQLSVRPEEIGLPHSANKQGAIRPYTHTILPKRAEENTKAGVGDQQLYRDRIAARCELKRRVHIVSTLERSNVYFPLRQLRQRSLEPRQLDHLPETASISSIVARIVPRFACA